MRRVTILFDHEELYREVKAEAAREGRPVKDVVAEALEDWLRRREMWARSDAALRMLDQTRAPKLTPEEIRTRREAALRILDEIRAKQPMRETVLDTLYELREERS